MPETPPASNSPVHPPKPDEVSRLKVALITVLAVIGLFASVTRVNFKGRWEGIFLLKGASGALFELKDDLYLGDGHRLITGFDLDRPEFLLKSVFDKRVEGQPYLDYEWDEKDGSGFVRNIMPDGTELFTSFSRFSSDSGEDPHGLFVGGGLPSHVHDDDTAGEDDTGMAYWDGKRWYHIWCTVNEGVANLSDPKVLDPFRWKFIGSRVLNRSATRLVLESSHEVEVDGAPLRVDRYAYFRAGDPFFVLTVRIRNMGDNPVKYYYVYGDEPWVGNYGTSAGNVGWVKDRVIGFEQRVDTRKYHWAGVWDDGNDAIGEGHDFTKAANFIEWLGPIGPTVYFSNKGGDVPRKYKGTVPLSGDSRFIGLYWGPREIRPGKADSYELVIGMALRDPKTGFPVKPEVWAEGGR